MSRQDDNGHVRPLKLKTRRRNRRLKAAIGAVDAAGALLATMRPDQVAFADHLLRSWLRRAFSCANLHRPIARRAIRKALEQRP